jgi:hypothetical protein
MAAEDVKERLPEDVAATLQEIVELGFVRVVSGSVVLALSPLASVYEDRMISTVKYLREYVQHHPEFVGEFFVCVYDGWREYGDPEIDPSKRRYVPWSSMLAMDKRQFLGQGSCGEPRFIHHHPDRTLYPVLCRPVLAYCRQIGDPSVLLIPDSEFIETEFKSFADKVRAFKGTHEQMRQKLYWRGSRNVNAGYSYVAMPPVHQRNLLVNLASQPELMVAPHVKFTDICDASFERTEISDQLLYRYQLDVDGMVSAWSALYWKLLSPAVVVKTPTHWEQWYYSELQPYVHFVPMKTFADLPNIFFWCSTHPDECAAIAAEATKFAEKLTMRYAIVDYKIK